MAQKKTVHSKIVSSFWLGMVCPRRFSFSQFVVLMSTRPGKLSKLHGIPNFLNWNKMMTRKGNCIWTCLDCLHFMKSAQPNPRAETNFIWIHSYVSKEYKLQTVFCVGVPMSLLDKFSDPLPPKGAVSFKLALPLFVWCKSYWVTPMRAGGWARYVTLGGRAYPCYLDII